MTTTITAHPLRENSELVDADPPVATILVVDDDPAKRLALKALLAPLDIRIVEVDSGIAALRAVLSETFAMILMAVRMPGMDGYETARRIRQRDRAALTPIIFVSALRDDEMQTAAAYASGAVDFVSTPVVPAVLQAKVSAFVNVFLQSRELQRSLDSIMDLNAALRDSELRAQAVLDNVSEGIFIVDDDGVIESVNRSVGDLFGYPTDSPVGQAFSSMVAPERRDDLRAGTRASGEPLTRRGKTRRVVETLGRRRDGSTFPMELERGDVRDGARSFTLASVRDITARKADTEALEHQALHDGLTGLANRTLFGEHVIRALAAAKRESDARAVLVMDLDGFKQVNDTLGHDRGDDLLRQCAERLADAVRENDTIARLGGDEFAILPVGHTDLAAAATIAWKIQQAFKPAFRLHDEMLSVSPSIGIALFPEHGETAEELLRRADLAMYDAKRSGSGYAVSDAAQERQTAQRLALLLDLRQCVARDELVLHYQPKINLVTREIAGVEALVRWRHPEHGLLLPGRFMPEAEGSEVIEPLTTWVLDAALRQQKVWRDQGIDLTMAVNVSARSLRLESDFPDTVAELLSRWGTTAKGLTLELTEGALIEAAGFDVLSRLHDMGARLSIDDFGTGYSSLAYLQRLPVDEIKLDKSFVTHIATAGHDAIIVRSTIDLAHNLDLTVVAEGVEDDVVLAMLVDYECDAAQGYHFGRAVAAHDLMTWLSESPYATNAPPGR